MSWAFAQSSGDWSRDGQHYARGYSGHYQGRNNPLMQMVKRVGPIPRGAWRICGPPVDTESHGPFVLRLEPKLGTQTFGRSGFLIHGDSVAHPGDASEGCIILPREVREAVWASGDTDLVVCATPEEVLQLNQPKEQS